jgi:hypothetical protein
MPVSMKVDFFQVVMPESFADPFKDVCQAVSAMNARNRNFPNGDAVIRLHKLHVDGKLVEGDMVRLRMNALPAKCNLDGQLEDIDFDDEEGVAEQTAFLFDPRTKVLLLQRNKIGVGGNTFARYFAEKGRVPEVITLLPIIKPKTMQRLAKFQQVRKLRIAIAKPPSSSPLHGVQHGDGPVAMTSYLRTMQYLQAPRMEM